LQVGLVPEEFGARVREYQRLGAPAGSVLNDLPMIREFVQDEYKRYPVPLPFAQDLSLTLKYAGGGIKRDVEEDRKGIFEKIEGLSIMYREKAASTKAE